MGDGGYKFGDHCTSCGYMVSCGLPPCDDCWPSKWVDRDTKSDAWLIAQELRVADVPSDQVQAAIDFLENL